MTNIPLTPPPPVQPLIASRKHTAIFLAIAAVVTLLGMAQARNATAVPAGAGSKVIQYLILIGLQLVWVRFVHKGMQRQGHSVAELIGSRWMTPRSVAADLFFGAIGLLAGIGAAKGLRVVFGDQANVAFLIPRGVIQSLIWVAVSITAGICEEIVFRGYFQRQLLAMTGSAALGIVLQAVIFGIVHGYQGLSSIAVTGSIGLILGVLAWYRGNIRAGAWAHAAMDIIGGLVRN